MPDRRSSRFIQSITRNGSLFSRLRDQPTQSVGHRHGRIDTSEPLLASAGLRQRNQQGNEPQWAFADGHRCYLAVPSMPDLQLLPGTGGPNAGGPNAGGPNAGGPSTGVPDPACRLKRSTYPSDDEVSSTALDTTFPHSAQTQPSTRPDLGAAGPQGDPGDEEDDDEESWTDDLLDADLLDDLVDDDLLDDDLIDEESFDRESFGPLDDDSLVIEDWADGPFQPARDLAPWPIETPDDAIDTFELLRSPALHSGLVVLVLDHDRVPFLHVALRGNPVDDVQRALSLFCPSLPNGRIPGGLILGVVRSHHREAPQSVLDSGEPFAEPSIWVDPVESAAWRVAAWNLHDDGIKLHDVIVIEPDRWMSLAHCAGLVAYDTLQYA